MLTLPANHEMEAASQQTVSDITTQTYTEINGDKNENSVEEDHTNGLIGDLAWILLLGAVVTLLFKKMKQPVVLGYIPRRLSCQPEIHVSPFDFKS